MNSLKALDHTVNEVIKPHLFEQVTPDRITQITASLKERGIDHVTWTQNVDKHSFTFRTSLDGKDVQLTYRVNW